MPTVFRVDGFTISILLPPREHGPAHVHVRKAGEEIVIFLSPIVTSDNNMTRTNGREALRLVQNNVAFLLSQWRKIHG